MRALHAGRCSKLLATARSSRAASAVSAFSLYCDAACARKSSPGNSGKVAVPVEPGVAEVESSTPEAMWWPPCQTSASTDPPPPQSASASGTVVALRQRFDSSQRTTLPSRHGPLDRYKGALTFTHTERGYTPVLPHCMYPSLVRAASLLTISSRKRQWTTWRWSLRGYTTCSWSTWSNPERNPRRRSASRRSSPHY